MYPLEVYTDTFDTFDAFPSMYLYMSSMELLKFINNNQNWKELLSEAPYYLKIKEQDGFTLLKYDLLYSDFSEPIVRECRGIILNGNNDIVCFPFYKFFNYGESYADSIDWNTARVQQKVDGSIMKLWFYDGKWRLSSNGAVGAYKAKPDDNALLDKEKEFYFGQLFESAVNYKDIDYSSLNKDYTYIFELTSPLAKVVIYYPETSIWHIGTRNNRTFEELDVDIGVKKPASYPLKTMDDCIEAAKMLPSDQEGFVVVDADWHRIKIKNPTYLRLHRMLGNKKLQSVDIINLLLENEQDEFLCYFPEYSKTVEEHKRKLDAFKSKLLSNYERFASMECSRKEIAAEIIKTDAENSYFYFYKLDRPSYSIETYLNSATKEKLILKLGLSND